MIVLILNISLPFFFVSEPTNPVTFASVFRKR